MKERPILFSAPMVRAILDDRKSQTRRAINPQPANGWAPEEPPVLGRITSEHPNRARFGVFLRHGIGTVYPAADLMPCPYGAPGDLLWVRETWSRARLHPLAGNIFYRADGNVRGVQTALSYVEREARWRPSIHMPRWASRILLRITDIRVERLQAISEADGLAEGIIEQTSQIDAGWQDYWPSEDGEPYASAREAYRALWESINGAGSWDANPWVWVIEFERVKP